MPAVTGRGSCFTADRIREDPECLTSAPQADTARPAARMFFAALMSRSCREPHEGHVQCRVERLSSASRCPHVEQVLLDGYQRSTTISSRPTRSHLYSNWRRNSPEPQSEMTRARCRLRTMFLTARSSITIVLAERTRRVLARCRKSRRALRTFRWALATFTFGLDPVGGAALAAGHAPLIAGQVPGLALQVPGVGEPLPVRSYREVLHPEIDADRIPRLRQKVRLGRVDGEGHVPAAVRLAGHDHHCRVQAGHVHVRPRPHKPQRRARLCQPQLASAHSECATGVVRGLTRPARLEPRVAGTPGEERAERLVLVPERLLQRHRGDLRQERQVRVLLHRGQRRVRCGVGQAFAFGVVQPVALGEGPVPHDPDAAERARQHLLLRLIRVSPAPVSRPHPDRIARLIEKPLEPRRAGVCLLVPLHGAPESSRPEGRGIPRRYW